MRYVITGSVYGKKRGDVVEFDTLPRAYVGKVKAVPASGQEELFEPPAPPAKRARKRK